MKRYGLIGHPLKHSQSKTLFEAKFAYEGLDCRYQNFDLKNIEELHDVMEKYPDLCGFNVTIPYKESIIPLLDDIDAVAREVGAVNVVTIREGKLKGYNTDVDGFEQLLNRAINGKTIEHALVLGTGGASKAVQYVLRKHDIAFATVSRSEERGNYTYENLNDDILQHNTLIINTTPLGMAPHYDEFPDIHYQALSKHHVLIDLIYNPKETAFMELGKSWNAKVYGGMQMFEEQAKRTWEIFNGNYGL
ncbi:MAG: shikimate dehydrogenase [Bacteroidales bacterium]|nr:shikimate dehydrogenase [Bacteroidales bacterium]